MKLPSTRPTNNKKNNHQLTYKLQKLKLQNEIT